MCGMQLNGLDSLRSLSLPSDTYNAYSSDASDRGFHLREDSHILSDEIDHLHHLSSRELSSATHASPLPRQGSVSTIEQNFCPQGNIDNTEAPASLDGFEEELEPLWDLGNSSRSLPTSLHPSHGTHSRDRSLARGIQEDTNRNTMDFSLSTDRVFSAQCYLSPDKEQQKMGDPMQLVRPVEESSGDSEHVRPTQNSSPAESELATGSIRSENHSLMLNNSPPSPGTRLEELPVMNDADSGLLDQPPDGYRYIGPRSIACRDTMVEIQSSTSSKKETNSACTTRLDRYGCSESPGHAHIEQNICHNNGTTSDEVPENSASHHFVQSAGTEFDAGRETDKIECITLPNHTQSTDGPNLTEPTLHSHRTRNRVVFSHVEIRNPKKADKDNESARLAHQCDCLYPENTSPIPSSNPHYPWCLSGTTLSIDIRKAERLPITVGYSAFRVVDDQLFQILTLSHGNVGSPSAKGQSRDLAVPIYSAENRKRSNRIWSSTKRGPLSPTEKRKLVALRDNGHTWNEIATRFPQRKRGTLQSIYYSQMKSTRDRVTLTREDLRRRHSACNSRHSVLSGGSESTGISADEARSEPISHSRYSFRPRRGPRF